MIGEYMVGGKLTAVDRATTIVGRHKATVCAMLLILYKMDITQGGELSLNLLNDVRLYTPMETIIL